MQQTSAKPRRATLKDIAGLAGVSVSTASLVLSGKGAERRISAEVMQRVQDVAREQDYSPNLLVHSMQRGRTNILSFYSSFHNRERNDIYMDRISAAIERAAGRLHYDVLIHCDFSRPVEELYQALNGGRADGLIFFGPGQGDPLLPLLRTSRLPTVMLNHADEQGVLASVCDDMNAGMQQIAEELVALGHRRIAAIAGPSKSDAWARIAALQRHLATYRISIPEEWIVPVVQDNPAHAESALHALLEASESPTALFCWHDRTGYFMLEMCDRLGIVVPEQLSLVGYDGLHWPSTSRHILASIAVNIDAQAEAAVYLLDNIIQGKQESAVSHIHPVSLVGGTTLSCPDKRVL